MTFGKKLLARLVVAMLLEANFQIELRRKSFISEVEQGLVGWMALFTLGSFFCNQRPCHSQKSKNTNFTLYLLKN